jgi:molecular chaperone DnaK (HSP70)
MEEGGKKTYQEKIEEQLKELANKIEVLVAKAEKAKEDAKEKYAPQIEALRAKQESVRQTLEGLKEPGGAAWNDLKKGIDSAISDLKAAVQNAVARFKEEKGRTTPEPEGDMTEKDET